MPPRSGALVFAAMLVYGGLVTRQLQALEEVGPADRGYRRLARTGVVLGAFAGGVFALIVYVMVAKPAWLPG